MATFYSMIGVFLQGLAVSILLASTPTEAQNPREVKIKMNAMNITLEKTFQLIEKNSNYRFLYNSKEIPLNENVGIEYENESVYKILESLAQTFNLSFNVINEQIIVKKSENDDAPFITTIETCTVKGYVTDAESKEFLQGVTISLKGTTIGTFTDKRGYYEINNLKPGKYIVGASYVGYAAVTKEINLTAGKSAEVNFQLGQSAMNLDEVVVTGSISERSLKESANPISIIAPKELENRNLNTLNSVLQSVPGILISSKGDIQNQGRIASFGGRTANNIESGINIRGYTSSAAGGSPFKIILDGVELTDIGMINFLDPNQIEKIEIARGPMSSTLYGAGSSSGVLQIFTKRGIGSLNINFRTMLTSQESIFQDSNPFNTEYSLAINGNKGETGYNFGIDYLRTPISRFNLNNGINGEDLSVNAGVNSKIGNLSADLKIQFNTNRGGAYDANYLYGALSREQNWQVPASSPYKVYLIPTLTDYLSKVNGFVTSLNMRHVIGDNIFQNLSVGYSKSDYATIYNSPNTASDGSSYYLYSESGSQSINAKYFINWKNAFSDDFKLELTGGIDENSRKAANSMNSYTTKYTDDGSMTLNTKGMFSKSNSISETTGLFAETIMSYWDQFFMTVGFRSEKNNSYGDNTGWYNMPRVGLTYVNSFGEITVKPRISWGKSTQAVSPLYKNSSLSVYGPYSFYRLGNADLKPQSQVGWEYGADIFVTSNFSLSATYFDQEVQDIIQLVYYVDPAYYQKSQYINISKASNKGLELGAKAIYQAFTLDLTYTTITSKYGSGFPVSSQSSDPELHEGGRVLGIPASSFFARLSYNIPSLLPWSQKGGSLVLEYVYNGNEYNCDNIATVRTAIESSKIVYTYKEFSGYSTLNLRASYGVLNELNLFFDVRNLLNKQDVLYNGPMNGRTISLGLNLRY